MKKIKEILKNSNYDDAQFSEEELNNLKIKFTIKTKYLMYNALSGKRK